jgi:phage terminase small subunit
MVGGEAEAEKEEMRGRKPKPTAALKRAGRYINARHGDRSDVLYSGKPQMPRSLDAEGKRCWKVVIENTPPNILAAIDSQLLHGLCRWWSLWRRFDRKLSRSSDRETMISAAHAWDKFFRLSLEFGLCPVSRARLKSPSGDQQSADVLSLFTGDSG